MSCVVFRVAKVFESLKYRQLINALLIQVELEGFARPLRRLTHFAKPAAILEDFLSSAPTKSFRTVSVSAFNAQLTQNRNSRRK